MHIKMSVASMKISLKISIERNGVGKLISHKY
jgi:hypothetical protein